MKKKRKSMILRPVKQGKKVAILLSNKVLEEAGLTGEIQITVNPTGGLLLQSAEDEDDRLAFEAYKKVKRKYSRLFRRLANR